MAQKITPETILSTKPNLDKDNVKSAMIEFAGMKVIEAVDILSKDLPTNLREKMLNNVDKIISKIL